MTVQLTTRVGPGAGVGTYGTRPTFEVMHFPAGEAHVKVVDETDRGGPLTEVAIVRTPTADDLLVLAMWADAVRQRRGKSVVLMPYLPGARQDRGLPFGARVYAHVLDEVVDADQVIAMDVHSPVMVGLVPALTHVSPAQLIRHAVVGRPDLDQPQSYDVVVASDAGAVDRARAVADLCGLPLVRATKHRDPATGRLSGFECEPVDPTKRHLVVDDICDAGGTFLGLADATGLPPDRLGLFVTHGVFSPGAERLGDRYGAVFSTDSYAPQTTVPNHRTIPATPYLLEAIK